MEYEMDASKIGLLRAGFAAWVTDYERLYYRGDPARLSACPITIHGLLHIADSIVAAGPVWCSWAFPMERFCGVLQRAVKGRRFVWASIANVVLQQAQLAHVRNKFNLFGDHAISLRPPPNSRAIRFADCKRNSIDIYLLR
jgi:hypothetical protein